MKFKKLIFPISKTFAIIDKANSIKYLVDCGFSKNVIEFLLRIENLLRMIHMFYHSDHQSPSDQSISRLTNSLINN